MAEKKLSYTEAVAQIEQILARLRDEQIDVDTLAAEVKKLNAPLCPSICRKSARIKIIPFLSWKNFPN